MTFDQAVEIQIYFLVQGILYLDRLIKITVIR